MGVTRTPFTPTWIKEDIMRWRVPDIGDKRVRSRFLFLPKRIKSERRWLEVAKWEEQFVLDIYEGFYWRPIRWVEREEP